MQWSIDQFQSADYVMPEGQTTPYALRSCTYSNGGQYYLFFFSLILLILYGEHSRSIFHLLYFAGLKDACYGNYGNESRSETIIKLKIVL